MPSLGSVLSTEVINVSGAGTVTNSDIAADAAIVESKLALNFPTHSNANDPSAGQKAALVGTNGTPGAGNTYVTNSDTRNTNARTPAAHAVSHKSAGSDAIKLDELAAPTDVTTLNVSSTLHGLAPKAPADATTFLNGAATPAYAAVKDSDLSLSDITTNDVASTKHGFAPKTPGDATKYLNGASPAAYTAIAESHVTNLVADLAARAFDVDAMAYAIAL